MNDEQRRQDLVDRLRAEFDASFAREVRAEVDDVVELLAFRTGSGAYAARLDQVAAVQEIRSVTRVPGRLRGFEGIVGAQGQLVAVYDLSVLVAAPTAARSRRWLIVCREDRQLGLAVDAVDGYLRAPRGKLLSAADPGQGDLAVREMLDESPAPRLIVDLSRVLSAIRRALEVRGAGR